MKRLYWLLWAVCILAGTAAHSYELAQTRGTSLGNAILLSRPMPSDLVNFSAARYERGEWRLETGYNRAFELGELDQVLLAGAARYGHFTLAGGFSQFGQNDLYTEQLLKVSTAVHIESFAFGMGVSSLWLAFGGGYDGLSAATLNVGGSFTRNWLLAGFMVDNITSPKLSDGAPRNDPIYTVLAEYRGQRSLSLVGRVTAQRQERPRFSLAQHIGLGRYASLALGVVTAPFQFGGGIELSVRGSRIIYGASVHPVLGLSQTISVSYGGEQSRRGDRGDFE